MFHLKLTTAFVAILFLSACATLEKDYQNKVCNETGGYERGVNDARQGLLMNQSFAQSCEPSIIVAVQAGYKKGYQDGIAMVQADKPATQINGNIGGDNSKAYHCEAKAFSETFSAWGSSELEARLAATEKCTQKFHKMHCDRIECQH